jgi:hypothetical protein
MKHTRFLGALVMPLLLLATSTGCVPNPVTWLPDSSGFVYVGGKSGHDLLHYDIARQTQRVLLPETKTCWPAVSPDGKRVAVADLSAEGYKPSTLQVIVYTLKGKEIQRSKVFDWGKKRVAEVFPPPDRALPELFWGPQGDKIVVAADDATGIYDLKADRLQAVIPDTNPLVFGSTPIRPDGAGFLVADDRQIDFVDWQGLKAKIALEPDLPTLKKAHEDRLKKADTDPLFSPFESSAFEMLRSPFWFRSRWDGESAVVQSSTARAVIDSRNRVGKIDAVKPALTWDQGVIEHEYRFPASDVRIRMVTIRNVKFDEKKGGSRSSRRLEKEGGRDSKPLTIGDTKQEPYWLIPAPNGKLVAVGWLIWKDLGDGNAEVEDRGIMIINHQGDMVGDIWFPK